MNKRQGRAVGVGRRQAGRPLSRQEGSCGCEDMSRPSCSAKGEEGRADVIQEGSARLIYQQHSRTDHFSSEFIQIFAVFEDGFPTFVSRPAVVTALLDATRSS